MSNPSPNMDLAGLLDRAGISVKPLEWELDEDGFWIAACATGHYEVFNDTDAPAKKAIAENRHVERILSSLKAST